MKGRLFILAIAIFSNLSVGASFSERLETFCRLAEQDHTYLTANLESVLRGELSLEEIDRLAPLPSRKECELSFAFELEKAEFLLLVKQNANSGEVQVAKSEIFFGVPMTQKMKREDLEEAKADSLILLEMVTPPGSSPSSWSAEKAVEMKFESQLKEDSARQDLPNLWDELLVSLKTKINNLKRSPKLSVTSAAP